MFEGFAVVVKVEVKCPFGTEILGPHSNIPKEL